MDIVDFLLSRFEEDAREARKLLARSDLGLSDRWYEERLLRECEAKLTLLEIIGAARRSTLARFLLATGQEAESERAPEELEWTTLALAALAAPYEEHDEYQDVWRLTRRTS